MHRTGRLELALAAAMLLASFAVSHPGARAQQVPKPLTDLDALMEQALKHRDAGRAVERDYILDEVERFEALGPGRIVLYRQKREYQWYVREGRHVRSPIRFDGVVLTAAERRRHEDEWVAKEGGGRGRRGRRPQRPTPAPAPAEQVQADLATPSLSTPIPEPRFVSEAYFLDFEFKPGNYYLAGRETLEGREVLRIDYFPEEAIEPRSAGKDGKDGKKDSKPSDEEKYKNLDKQFDKTSQVTLWVDPVERQIVKFTFKNIWFDFLPFAWMARVKGIEASMIMERPFKDVWLPRNMTMHADFTLANGALEMNYTREFSNYTRAEVTSTIRPDPGRQ